MKAKHLLFAILILLFPSKTDAFFLDFVKLLFGWFLCPLFKIFCSEEKSCEPGFTRNETGLCDNIDDCASGQCYKGICQDEVQGFSCFCDEGWEGPTCNVSIRGQAIQYIIQEKGNISQDILDQFVPEFFDQIAGNLNGSQVQPGKLALSEESYGLLDEYGFTVGFSTLAIDGYFTPDSSVIANNTTIRAYTVTGYNGQTEVDPFNGYFYLGLTDLPAGRNPVLLVVAEPIANDAQPHELTRELLNLDGRSLKMPCIIYGVNNNLCSPATSYKLAWDGPTSDVDLHVYEKTHHVYFMNMVGDYGSLDLDDTNGYGPENYVAQNVGEPHVQSVQVHMFNYNSDVVVNWKLEARRNGELQWTETGTFDSQNSVEDFSPNFTMAVGPSTCGQCLVDASESNGNRKLTSGCCPPEKYTDDCWFFMWWCRETIRPSYTFWEEMNAITKPTVDQVKGLTRIIFDGTGRLPANQVIYDLAMTQIQDRNNCLPKLWNKLLQIFCATEAMQNALNGILDGKSMIGTIELIGKAAKGASIAELFMESAKKSLKGEAFTESVKVLKAYRADRLLLTEFQTETSECNRKPY